jgi:hypothetical protein
MCVKIKIGLRREVDNQEVVFNKFNRSIKLIFFIRKKFWECGHIFSI